MALVLAWLFLAAPESAAQVNTVVIPAGVEVAVPSRGQAPVKMAKSTPRRARVGRLAPLTPAASNTASLLPWVAAPVAAAAAAALAATLAGGGGSSNNATAAPSRTR